MSVRLWMRRRGWRAALLLLAAAALLLRLPLAADDVTDYLHRTPAALAHYLADFSNYHQADETIGAWWVEEEGGNYTWWRYVAGFECGTRCRGRAVLQSHALHAARAAPQHGAALQHRLYLSDRRCLALPLLPWQMFCDESQVEMEVSPLGEGAGSRLLRRARYSCSALSLLADRCRPPAAHTPAALAPT